MKLQTPEELKDFKTTGFVQTGYEEECEEEWADFNTIQLLDSPLSEEDFVEGLEFIPIVISSVAIIQGQYINITLRDYGGLVTWLAIIQDDMYETCKVGVGRTMEQAKRDSREWVARSLTQA